MHSTILGTSLSAPAGVPGNITVAYPNPINGKITWKNNNIAPGAVIFPMFLIGHAADESFPVLVQNGYQFYCGSYDGAYAPSIGSQQTDDIYSRAYWIYPDEDSTTWDVLAIIADFHNPEEVLLNSLFYDDGVNLWIIGIEVQTLQNNLIALGAEWFTDKLTVTRPVPPINVVSFQFIPGV